MEFLTITQNLGVRTIALNRPERRNAFHPGMIQEITTAFKQAARDKTVRAILLTAEGQSFCSGGDLEWMKSMAKYTQKQNVKDAEQLFEMYWSIRTAPVPVIGRVFGHAFGGGAGLLAVCDMVAAEEKTQICFSEVKWGLVPAVISPFVVERVAAGRVREWFLTAKVFGATEAKDAGLVSFVGGIAQVDAYVEETLRLLRAAAPEAVRESKKLHQSYSSVNWRQAKTKVTKLIAARRVSAEGQAGLQAFLDKTNPPWMDNGRLAKI
jgi:methylglutaconyl-CoA hydratase